ncbi:hypothetical protein QQM39_10880 [Streptomyces sp. DT2A-34]|uniref:hypothetical protein n=1 Tax=Streptomyces sp. DT2A-34 TaxID=3051182 RepID=UPI00265BF9D7|nr:hypothetical protein [Streptomyces sp. DT2A-34]MDO0911337.1 hypothetical protein [Streptomyces sp. DT2A-34]
MSGGYDVDPQLLQQLSKNLNAAMDELKEVTDATEATTGQGFEDLALPPNAVGAARPAQALKDFASRWSWEVQTLLDEGNQIAEALDLNAGYYHEAEEYGKGALKDVAAAFVAPPTITSEQAQKMSTQDLTAAVKENGSFHYSGDDFNKGFSQARKSLSAEWDDVTSSGQTGLGIDAIKEAASPGQDGASR